MSGNSFFSIQFFVKELNRIEEIILAKVCKSDSHFIVMQIFDLLELLRRIFSVVNDVNI